jgi:triphosphoribosyl-dephospho-CoA synthase
MDLSLGQCAQCACLWEVTAPKAGNVHQHRDFADLTFADFVASAHAIAPIFDKASQQAVGQTVLNAIRATRRVVATNTNLGIVLLLAPLAAVPRGLSLRQGLPVILESLTIEDSRDVFAAIRLATPGGLGSVAEEDIATEPTMPLRRVMELAAERDLVARQYAADYKDVFDVGLPALLDGFEHRGSADDAIVFAHLVLLAYYPDSLIARKRGLEEAKEAGRRAMDVLNAGWPESAWGQAAFADLDGWLTAVGNARNPGTSADLVTACLFAGLRDNKIPHPRLPKS